MNTGRARRLFGFTLSELLISIAICSVMSVFAYQGLRNFMLARTIISTQSALFAEIVGGFTIMQQDFGEVIPRPVRDGLGSPEPSMRSGLGRGEILALTRHTAWADMGIGSSDLKRIEYRLADGQLFRRVWGVLDRTPDTTFHERVILNNLAQISLRYHQQEQWMEVWPPADQLAPLNALPDAIMVSVIFSDGRSINRTMRVSGPN